jgi:S1-C subfamily serine protease
MTETLKQLSDEMATLVTASSNAVVRIDGRQRLAASGIVWQADGVIITAHHVVERDEGVKVGLPDGTTVDATVVGRDPGVDLAVLRVNHSALTAATWLDGHDLKVGHLVLALGRPGAQTQATLGIISALGGEWRTHAGGAVDTYLQTDVVMYPGFSGGPLVSADGRFAGMNTSGLTRSTSVAVPSATIARVVQSILAHGHVPRGYLGIGVQPVRLADNLQQLAGQEIGLMIMSVEADGPAAHAGLVQGDVITSLDGTPIRQVDELQAFLGSDRVGQVLTAHLLRGGAVQQLTVTVGQSRGA